MYREACGVVGSVSVRQLSQDDQRQQYQDAITESCDSVRSLDIKSAYTLFMHKKHENNHTITQQQNTQRHKQH